MSARIVYGIVGWLAGFALGLAVTLAVATTFEVGLLLGIALPVLGGLLGLAAAPNPSSTGSSSNAGRDVSIPKSSVKAGGEVSSHG